jgi:putative peptidoglycan lipid II flippase
MILFLTIPATVGLVAVGEPIVRLLFERGEFSAANTTLVAAALQGFAVGLIGNGAIQLLMRAFFSLRSPWTPAMVGFGVNLLGNVILGGLLHEAYGVRGITLAMAIANTASFVVMYGILRRRLGGAPIRPILSAIVLSGAISAVAVAIGWAALRGIDAAIGDGVPAQALGMLVAVTLTWGLYAPLALKLRLVNAPQLRRALRRGR